MSVNKDDFDKLQKTVDHLMKIIGVFGNSMKSVKEKVSDLEEKVKDMNTDKSHDKETETNEAEIIKLKQLLTKNKEDIKSIDETLKKLKDDQLSISEKCKSNQIIVPSEINKLNKNVSETFKCKVCDITFDETNMLGMHRKNKHPKVIECKDCKIGFQKISELEEHLFDEHTEKKKYECEFCDMTFVMKWRMKKHIDDHQDTKQRTCHYFNNNVECPYAKVGCKFLHKEAAQCKYNKLCSRLKCQYKHE